MKTSTEGPADGIDKSWLGLEQPQSGPVAIAAVPQGNPYVLPPDIAPGMTLPEYRKERYA
jgi:hypothetical protein